MWRPLVDSVFSNVQMNQSKGLQDRIHDWPTTDWSPIQRVSTLASHSDFPFQSSPIPFFEALTSFDCLWKAPQHLDRKTEWLEKRGILSPKKWGVFLRTHVVFVKINWGLVFSSHFDWNTPKTNQCLPPERSFDMDISYSCSKVRKTKTKTIRSGNAASKMRKKKDMGEDSSLSLSLSLSLS